MEIDVGEIDSCETSLPNEPSNTSDVVDVYLKKYKLDLKLLPNKKMIKLSDICSNSTNLMTFEETEDEESFEDLDEQDEFDTDPKTSKKLRKKREPSLKLQQKLTTQDLEIIVSLVRDKQAQVFIADIKKDDYVDKILRVQLNNGVLSNGKSEALLKKSIFPKELNTLFDTFINSLCGQDSVSDDNGNCKPVLKCLVVDCEFNSFSEAEILRHIKRHLAQDGYTCPECSHQFASMTNLQRHLKIHSGDLGKEVKCPQCDYKASTITHVKRHMAHKHLERSLPCPHCTFMGATNAELKIHMARKHLELTGKNPLFLPKYLRKDYQCNLCKEQFNDFKEYQTHMYKHTSSSNRFRCTECPYNCKNYSKLKRHMLYHMGARNFECTICGNKFFQMEHLKRHMQSIHNSSIANLSTKAKKAEESEKNPLASTISNVQTNQQITQSYTVLTKCLYKCQKCSFNSEELFDLNQHIIKEHTQKTLNDSQLDIINNDSLYDYGEESDEDEENFSEFEENFEHEDDLLCYMCSFCNYKTDKKSFLRSHLIKNHSSDVINPIILNNDSLVTDPNTKFQCGSCSFLLDNINDFTKHMMEKHKINVYLIDAPQNDQNLLQPQVKVNNKTAKSNESKQQKTNKKQQVSVNKSLGVQSRQTKNIYSKSVSLSSQAETTVRINPLYLKQFQSNNHQKCSKFDDDYQSGQIVNEFISHQNLINHNLDF
ncbi:unnamed protein product [Brachionus calyciflorus]|uniref:C2H2-type domain-containing protein n=1 Tax=Brachionus calyciflorus TaxID=104777 RepID=A0A813M3Z2_9BILA|nr:unnamed protein product [Brachionus calyciflorus]